MGVKSEVSVLTRVFKALVTGLLLIGVGGCAGGGSDGTGGIVQRTFVGEVHDQNGNPLPGEQIEFRSAGGVESGITDAEGGFEVSLEVYVSDVNQSLQVEVQVGETAQGSFDAPRAEIVALDLTVENDIVTVEIIDFSEDVQDEAEEGSSDPLTNTAPTGGSPTSNGDNNDQKKDKPESGGTPNGEENGGSAPPDGSGPILQDGTGDHGDVEAPRPDVEMGDPAPPPSEPVGGSSGTFLGGSGGSPGDGGGSNPPDDSPPTPDGSDDSGSGDEGSGEIGTVPGGGIISPPDGDSPADASPGLGGR